MDREWCPISPLAPPVTRFAGTTTERDRYYGSKWVTSQNGNISFEEESRLSPTSQSPSLSLDAHKLSRIGIFGGNMPGKRSSPGGLPTSSISRLGTSAAPHIPFSRPTSSALATANTDRAHLRSRYEKRRDAENTLLEFKWKSNGLAVPNTPIPARSAVVLRGECNFNEHIPGTLSPWKPTPRELRDKDRVKATIRKRIDIARPSEFEAYKPDLGQGMVVQAIQIARMAKSKGRYNETRKPYFPVERELFQSPYNKPCWGNKFAYEPKLSLSNF
jgi:hypothetical protein